VTSLTDLLMAFPNHRIEGALLGRDTLLHWGFGIISAAGYLGLLFGMFPGTHKRTLRLLLVGLFTGTIGVMLLLAFQVIAEATQGVMIRGRGLGILIFLVFKLIGWSYRCASDPNIGFWGSFFGFTIGVGLCEELCKSLPIRHYLRTARKTGWRGACLTGLASGIGFGVSEGIMYSGSMYNGISDGFTYIIRFVSCVSLHAMWSGSVALMMYKNPDFLDTDEWGDFILGMLYYISIAMVLHGLYDTLLKHDLEWVALLIGLGSYCWMFYLVRESRGT
jgi:RsiW-degrading membrane proteinase PrsW (M82 family)